MSSKSCNFTFGSGHSYYFKTPSTMSRAGLPEHLDVFFTKSPPISKTYNLALGPNQSYFCAYTDADGKNFVVRQGLPPQLDQWLFNPQTGAFQRDIESIRVVLGTDNLYWAQDKKGLSWFVPGDMEAFLKNHQDPHGPRGWKPGCLPVQVALGANSAFYVKLFNGEGLYNFRDHNKQLGTFLKALPNLREVAAVYLNICSEDSFITVLGNGESFSSLPPNSESGFEYLKSTIPAVMTDTKHPGGPGSPPPNYPGPPAYGAPPMAGSTDRSLGGSGPGDSGSKSLFGGGHGLTKMLAKPLGKKLAKAGGALGVAGAATGAVAGMDQGTSRDWYDGTSDYSYDYSNYYDYSTDYSSWYDYSGGYDYSGYDYSSYDYTDYSYGGYDYTDYTSYDYYSDYSLALI